MNQALEKIKSLLPFKYKKKFTKPSMNSTLKQQNQEKINSMFGISGIVSIKGSEIPLKNSKVKELLKKPIRNKDEMNKRLKELRIYFPMLSFHYSNYFGIKPKGDKKRQECKYNSTESYYDISY